MSLTSFKYQKLLSKSPNNIYRGTILLFVTSLAIWRSPQANAAPIEATADSGKIVAEQDSEVEFGTAGQEHWYVQGALATTLDREESNPRRFILGGAGISKFVYDGHSLNLELNTIYFEQPDNNALGLNLALLFRWHFVRQTNWSLYIDGGAGIMGTTNDVPSVGANFNFTPQAGGGASIKLNNERRLLLGLRWHHISHADLFGANPGRDSLMGYVGLKLPR